MDEVDVVDTIDNIGGEDEERGLTKEHYVAAVDEESKVRSSAVREMHLPSLIRAYALSPVLIVFSLFF